MSGGRIADKLLFPRADGFAFFSLSLFCIDVLSLERCDNFDFTSYQKPYIAIKMMRMQSVYLVFVLKIVWGILWPIPVIIVIPISYILCVNECNGKKPVVIRYTAFRMSCDQHQQNYHLFCIVWCNKTKGKTPHTRTHLQRQERAKKRWKRKTNVIENKTRKMLYIYVYTREIHSKYVQWFTSVWSLWEWICRKIKMQNQNTTISILYTYIHKRRFILHRTEDTFILNWRVKDYIFCQFRVAFVQFFSLYLSLCLFLSHI